MPIKIQVVEDVSSVIKGTKDVADAFDKVADSLDDVAQEAKDTGRILEREVGGSAEDASREVDRLEESFREMAKAASKQSKAAGDDLGDNIKRGTREAEGGLDDFKSEAGSTARETAASFDGSAESIAGAFQEVAANALGAFGPLGAGIGLGLAAAGGALYASINENAAKSEERIQTMYEDMVASGERFVSQDFIRTNLQDILGRSEDAIITWTELQEQVAATGLSLETVARAYAGDAEAGAAVTQAFNDKLAEQAAIADEAAGKQQTLGQEYYNNNTRIQEAADRWREQGATMDDAKARTDAYQSAAVAAGVATVKSAEEAQSRYDGLGRTISELPANKSVSVSVGIDVAGAEYDLQQFLNRRRRMGVGVGFTEQAV